MIEIPNQRIDLKHKNTEKSFKLLCVCLLFASGLALSQTDKLGLNNEIKSLLKFAASGDLKSVQQTLASGLDINAKDPVFHATALHNASSQGHVHVVDWLIEKGALIEVPDQMGSTPLIWAAYAGQLHTVQSLIQADANLNHLPLQGSTALVSAVQSGQIDVVETLLENGAKKTIESSDGMTAIEAAKLTNNPAILKLLMHSGDES